MNVGVRRFRLDIAWWHRNGLPISTIEQTFQVDIRLIDRVRRASGRLARQLRRKGEHTEAELIFTPDIEADARETILQAKPFTMTSVERLYALIKAAEYVVRNHISGDFVECGVWRGGSMMAAAATLLRLNSADRELYLFDTFDGMPPPSAQDRNLRGESAAELLAKSDRESTWVWAVAQLDDVQHNMRSTSYPENRIHYVKGKVEDTLPARAPEKIALLRLDTDWYESTKHEMKHLFPRLVPGGVLIIDDYGHWQGARQAVDEYIARENIRCLLCRIDYTGRIAIKT